MSVQARGELSFRRMTVADLDGVMAIETAAFASPWSRQFFLEELQAARARSVLCQRNGEPVGYVIYWEVSGELDIHNVAVHPRHQRQGVGRAMLDHIIEGAAKRGSRRMTLEVRKSNDVAQALYRSLGFEVCGLRKGYYSDNGEDAWLMERTLQMPQQDPFYKLICFPIDSLDDLSTAGVYNWEPSVVKENVIETSISTPGPPSPETPSSGLAG